MDRLRIRRTHPRTGRQLSPNLRVILLRMLWAMLCCKYEVNQGHTMSRITKSYIRETTKVAGTAVGEQWQATRLDSGWAIQQTEPDGLVSDVRSGMTASELDLFCVGVRLGSKAEKGVHTEW